MDIEKINLEINEHPLQKLVPLANKICQESFMDYPDYDKDNPITTIEDALTILVMESLPHDIDVGSHEVYDFLIR